MVRNIVRLLSEKQRRRGVWVVFSVLARAILDFAGIAALVPILLIVVKQDGGRSMMLAVCGVVLLFVLLKNTLVMLLAHVQSCYQLEIYREFSTRMFANYYHRGLLYLKGKSSLLYRQFRCHALWLWCNFNHDHPAVLRASAPFLWISRQCTFLCKNLHRHCCDWISISDCKHWYEQADPRRRKSALFNDFHADRCHCKYDS